MNKKILFILILFPILFNACQHNVEIPIPMKITGVINGEEYKDLKPGKAKFQMMLNEAGKALASTLIVWGKEEFSREQIFSMMSEKTNAFLLEYPKIIEMKVWMSGGYTKRIQFKNIYVIHVADKRMIFFYLPSKKIYKPYVPLTDSMRGNY